MPGGQALVARATATVLVEGGRAGSAVLVTPRYLVTAAHVLMRQDPDWLGEAGTFPGHSGGPVIDDDSHALAGILVEGSVPGRFDRFVPVTLIAWAWPGLPRPWLVTGADPGEARSHFTRRARGQRSSARGGDLFRGRQAALAAVRARHGHVTGWPP